MKSKTYIQGFNERLNAACHSSGLSKSEIAKRCSFDRKTLIRTDHAMMDGGNVARFCAVTKTDANWLLGVTHGANDDIRLPSRS